MMDASRIPVEVGRLGLLAGLFLLSLLARDGVAAADGGGSRSGDVFISLQSGAVQWWRSDGTFVKTLQGVVPGKAEGMAFDAAMNLYVTHHCADPACRSGNSVERFSPKGVSMGAFGGGYNCNPTSISFDAGGTCYVGQADCTGDLLAINAAGAHVASHDAAVEARGTIWIDIAADGCTVLYTSSGTRVMRFNICARAQLPDLATLPDTAYAVKALPGGGALVANNSVIVRLDSGGDVAQTYDIPGQPDLWLSLDPSGDGAFWAANYGSSNVYKIDLATGAVLGSFNTGTPYFTVKAVAVKRPPTAVTAGGRMTGGGSVFTMSRMRVTHGFELHCDVGHHPNTLEVNWQGHQFHLESLTFAECSDDPAIRPPPPAASFDTYHGVGSGRHNGEEGATIEFTLTDAGEPGRKDRATMTIKDPAGNIVLEVDNVLTFGNHQAHK
jgi:hypothetical protein